MGVKIGTKVSDCSDEIGEKDVFTITDETLLKGGGKKWKENEGWKR